MKFQSFVSRALIAVIALSQFTVGPVALGAYESSQQIVFNGRQTEFSLQLRGKKERTRYRTEYYQGTCYNTEYDTEYRRECTPIYQTQCTTDYRQECHTEYDRQCSEVPSCRDVNRPVCRTETRQECTSVPVCRDVMREVCNSSGCTSYPTRECTEEQRCRDISQQVCTDHLTRECTTETQCQDVPRQSCQTVPYEDCRQVAVGEDCQDVPYTVERQVPYSCQLSREVPDGTDLVEDIIVNAKVTFVGDFAQVTGQDSFVMSVANGVDVGANVPDLQIVSKNDAFTHVYQLKKIQETKRRITATESEITAHYQLTVTPAANIVSQFPGAPEIKTMKLNRDSVELGLSARAIHADSTISFKLLKDRAIGGWVSIYNGPVAFSQMQVQDTLSGQTAKIVFSNLGVQSIRNRPHQATIKLTGKPALPAMEGVLNVRTLERIRDQLAAQSREVTKTVTVRF